VSPFLDSNLVLSDLGADEPEGGGTGGLRRRNETGTQDGTDSLMGPLGRLLTAAEA
jgi:hypothetical protein